MIGVLVVLVGGAVGAGCGFFGGVVVAGRGGGDDLGFGAALYGFAGAAAGAVVGAGVAAAVVA